VGVLLVIGYGPGISQAVAARFAREGHGVALVARSRERADEAAAQLRAAGVAAAAYQADASDLASVRRAVASARQDLGPVSAVLWTAYRSGGVKDVLATAPENIERVFDIGVAGLLACVQEVLGDLKSSPGASVLVANGALGEHTTEADSYAKMLDNDGVALENAAKSKLVGILAERLREFGIYVGEVTIAGSVAGTATEAPSAIAPERIADQFWALTQTRDTTRLRMTPVS
jgi:NAD(P)-dependent dehydrogenase (short-subunit alcohol dehydrogenase family)